MRKCKNCPYEIPKTHYCQSCYIAEKARRIRVEANFAKALYEIEEIMKKMDVL